MDTNLDPFNKPENVQLTNVSGDTTGTVKVPVFAETVTIGKQFIESGKVFVHKMVEEKQEALSIELTKEEVITTRVPKNELITGVLPQTHYDGEIMIIPVLSEEYVLVKQTRLIEEIHVERRSVITQQHETVLLKHEKVTIERQEIR